MKHPSIPAPPKPDCFAAALQFFSEDLLDEVICSTRLVGPPRHRKVPRAKVAQMMIAAGLLGQHSFSDAWRALSDFYPGLEQPSDTALTLARQRLGVAPLLCLAQQVVRPLATPRSSSKSFYQGRRLIAFDGTTLSMPDTSANFKAFGGPSNQHGPCGYPQLRMLALCELGTHALLKWLIKPYGCSENSMAHTLVEHLQPRQLLLLDAAFFSFRLWQAVRQRKTHLLCRLQAGPTLKPIRYLKDGSYLAKIYPSSTDRLADRGGKIVRVIAYHHNDPKRARCKEPTRLVTSLLNPHVCPAKELIELYHERWEEELAFSELKTRLNGRKVHLRSKKPGLVMQEVYGLLLAHYAVRKIMVEAAQKESIEPTRLSFTKAFRTLVLRLPKSWGLDEAGLVVWYDHLLMEIGKCQLPERRNRVYPRVVKATRSKFPSKKKDEHQGCRLKPFREHVVIT